MESSIKFVLFLKKSNQVGLVEAFQSLAGQVEINLLHNNSMLLIVNKLFLSTRYQTIIHIIINYLYAGGQISAGRGCQDGFKDRGQFAPAAQLLGAQVATFSISSIVLLFSLVPFPSLLIFQHRGLALLAGERKRIGGFPSYIIIYPYELIYCVPIVHIL